jgi:tetratricopeptide (TPR) repeat protein
MAELCAGLEDARGGRGRFFLVTGEPGIGKTRLADEIAQQAASSAMTVLRSGCWEGGGAPAYWPFVQMLRAALSGAERDPLLKLLSAANAPHVAQDLAQLIPELQSSAAAPADASTQAAPNPEQARFRLFDSVAAAIRHLAAPRPLMLIVEDLHDADEPTLLMLRFMVRQLKNAPVMVLGTYRDFEVQRSPALSQHMGDLTREGTQVPLFALSREDAALMIQARAGAPPSPRLVSDIYQATAGNPLLIDGLVRVLAAEGGLSGTRHLNLAAFRVTGGVREAIRRWLALLADRALLVIAATIGQEFELRCLQRVTGAPNHQLLDSLRAAAGVGLVTPVSSGNFRFTHALIRNALCDELNSADRAAVHLKIGAAIEELYRVDVDVHAASLAHHFHEGGDIDKAIDYAIRAGEGARAVFAYEDALAHWHSALELITQRGEDPAHRAELLERTAELLGLTASEGDGQFKHLGQALKLYRDLGRPDAPARPDGPARVEARITGGLSEHPDHIYDSSLEGSRSAAWRATGKGDEPGDDVLSARGAIAHATSLFGRGRVAEAFALVRRVFDEADGLNDSIAGMGVVTLCNFMLNCLCDPIEGAARVQVALTKPWMTEASPLRGVLLSWLWRYDVLKGRLREGAGLFAQARGEPLVEGHIAFYRGELERADLILAQAFNHACRGGIHLRSSVFALWLAKVRRMLGQYPTAETLLRDSLAVCSEGPHLPLEMRTREELALLYAETARPEQAHLHLARCREVIAKGEDWRGLAGHVARSEGAVAAAEARFEAANEQFAKAVVIYRRYQVPFEEAETLHCWGRGLIAAGDRAMALEKLDAATELYRSHGAGERWLDAVQADRLRAQSVGATDAVRESGAAATTDLPADYQGENGGQRGEDPRMRGVFCQQGEYWTLSWANSESRLRDRKGLHYVAWLLRHPGQEFAAQDLVFALEPGSNGFTVAPVGDATIAHGLGDTGAALDAAAKAQYRHRLEDLRAELELAEQHNDLGRAARAREEIEFIEAELAAAVGLSGRDRKSASHAERARVAVTKAIKTALGRIRHADPELARHLALSIQTGYFCAYLPRQPATWEL